ncbi:MAG: hypothetical protein LBV44_09045 [Methylobacillus sp.]|jgi:hypothetical protein|nr:hypothetical protein [Methylobacillus sp.]
MKHMDFHQAGEDDGHFYALACCACGYQPRDTSTPSNLVMYFSPSANFSRFSFQCWDHEGRSQMYHRDPDYSPTPEAALLDMWVQEGVPAYAWRLFPLGRCNDFQSAEHQQKYAAARKELCAALYGLRIKAWAQRCLNVKPLIQPPPEGYSPADAYAESDENSEILNAALENHAD